MTATVQNLRPRGFVSEDGTPSVLGDEPKGAKGGRPRKYATEAERKAAYRARNKIVGWRLDPKTVALINEIANEVDISANELANQMLKFAAANRDWHAQPIFGRPLPNAAHKDKDKG